MKQGRHLLFRLVNGRCNNMTRRFLRQLNDVLTQICLNRFESSSLQCAIDVCLLTDHRLALGNRFSINRLADIDNDVIGIF